MVEFFEWSGTVLSLIGAASLAVNCRYSPLGWFAFLLANFCLLAMAILIDRHGLQLLQVGFTFTSLLGIWREGLFSRRALELFAGLAKDTRVIIAMILTRLFRRRSRL